MNINCLKSVGLAFALTLMGSVPVYAQPGAQTAKGRISVYHLNPTVTQRGACIKLDPLSQLPGDGWLCIWKDMLLYEETNKLLLEAYLNEKTCTIVWTNYRGGVPAPDYIICPGF
jgi:hypothetical protein